MTRAPGLHTKLRHGRALATVAAALLLVSGCGGGGTAAKDTAAKPSTTTPAAAGVVLDIKGSEYSFTPSKLKASAGETTIRFTNSGAMTHDFTIKALNVHLVAEPGKTAEATVTLKPGTYKSDCTIPGHAQSGMHGTLTVS